MERKFPGPSAQAHNAEMARAVENDLRTLGARHIANLARARASEQQLRPLVLAALQVGIPTAKVVQLTGLAPAVIERWSTRTTPRP